jgi:hypothetical protein
MTKYEVTELNIDAKKSQMSCKKHAQKSVVWYSKGPNDSNFLTAAMMASEIMADAPERCSITALEERSSMIRG